MKFWRRLRYYGVGLIIGIILSVVLFNGRGCEWLPDNRVLSRIGEESTVLLAGNVACALPEAEITEAQIRDALISQELEVYFSESDTDEDPKRYVLKNDEESLELHVEVKDSIATVVYVRNGEKEATGECTDHALRTLYMPDEQLRSGLLKRELKYTKQAGCIMKSIGMDNDEFVRLLEEGEVDQEASTPWQNETPEWIITGNSNGRDVRLTVQLTADAAVLTNISCSVCRCDE
jgi:hypothetical protein